MSLEQQALDAWNTFRDLPAGSAEKEAAHNALVAANAARDGARGGGGGNGGGGGTAPVDPAMQLFQMQQQIQQQNVISTLTATFNEYGLGSLVPKMIGWAKQNYNAEAIMALIRQTSEYKARFPAMEALAKKGRAISEAVYIDYERNASTLERQYGLPSGMLMGNVTNLLSSEVSLSELNDRVLLASANSIQAPPELRQTLQRFYGIDSGGLTAYFLDPNVATPLLERQAASAAIGTEAVRQGIGIDVYGAENLQQLGITTEGARLGFGQVAAQRPFSEGRGDVVTQDQMIAGTFYDVQAGREVERVRESRLGRFQAGGQFVSTERGVSGLAQPGV
jgi:hypothetical protein